MGPDGEQTGEFSTLLNPGCDPGPVHIHGLTTERLRGAPTFEQVARQLAAILRGRVMVAHNAQFDYGFLAHEFARAGQRLPVDQRLCTLALNRRLGPPTRNLQLSTLAAHYGIRQQRAHDALDDTRVLAGVLRGSLAAAARLGLSLPLVACPPQQTSQFTPSIPKTPCAFRNPGRLSAGGPLVQGMKIAITGETKTPRTDLVARGVAAGLNVMNSVSRHTSALVTNDHGSGSTKARRAASEGVQILDEGTFLRLLEEVRPGVRLETSPAATAPTEHLAAEPSKERDAPPSQVEAKAQSDKPLAGRRVLVLGGSHKRASKARGRVVELEGAAAVNFSGSVTDVVTLPGGEADRRMSRVRSLGLPVHDEKWLDSPDNAPAPPENGATATRPSATLVLPRGGVIDLPVTVDATKWTITASWAQQTAWEVDVVAFAVDKDGQVSCDEDFVFYGAPESPNGAVQLSTDGPTEQAITIDLTALPRDLPRVVIAAAIDGTATFGDVGAVEITASPGISESLLAQATLDAATTERMLLLAEVYQRGPSWRLRAVGQGYDFGLDELARSFGVDVKD
jgi:DNA polymerase-3 subunit epsilon